MKIKQVKCDQFAGVIDKDWKFDDGMNVVVGDNESGKSTMMDLIYQILFKDAKHDGRNTDFVNTYFPKKVKGPAGDVVDGVLVFETENGTYRLKKEWDKGEGECRLTLPDGTSIKNVDKIKEILDEELEHRQGVYNEIVFATQKRAQMSVESIMRSLSKKSNEVVDLQADLTSALDQAVLEVGGVPLDQIEKQILEKMKPYKGNWDLAADEPRGGSKRGIKNKYKTNVGSVLQSYYEMEEVREEQRNALAAEQVVEQENALLQDIVAKKKEVELQRNNFLKYRDMLGQMTLLSKMIADQKGVILEQEDAIVKWPTLMKNKDQAIALSKEKQHAEIHELYCKAEAVQKQLGEKEAEFAKLQTVDSEDVKNVRSYISTKQLEENKLAGMNLIAKLKQLGDVPVEVISVATGKAVDVKDGELAITEAVTMTIPGVFEMQLLPQGVDVDQVQSTIKELDEKIKSIFQKYSVQEIAQLEKLEQTYILAKQEVEQLKLSLERVLGDVTWDEVVASHAQVPETVGTVAEVQAKIDSLCCGKALDAYVGGLETTLDTYVGKYGTLESLQGQVAKLRKEQQANEEKLAALDEIPEEYKGIDNPELFDQNLLAKVESYEAQAEAHTANVREAERKLGEKTADEYLEEVQEKEAKHKQLKTEYKRWNHIYEVFCNKKNATGGSSVSDIEEKFKEYLEVITSGGVTLTNMDDNMEVDLASGNHALNYKILSEGTRDTISLAFRLAMLEHLYPNGNGMAIFDDPFTDMDPTRVGIACDLLKKFALHNQVIFVTCDGKYQNMLGGNTIQVSR